MAVSLPVFEPFDCTDAASSGPRWRRWLARFEVMMSGMKIGVDSNEDKLQRKSLLLHYIGGEGFDVYETLKADDDDYAAVKKKLTDYFMPKLMSNMNAMCFVMPNKRMVKLWTSSVPA